MMGKGCHRFVFLPVSYVVDKLQMLFMGLYVALPQIFSGEKPDPRLPDLYRCRLDQGAHGGVVQEICLNKNQCSVHWRDVRPIPEVDYFFENQWKAYRERMGI